MLVFSHAVPQSKPQTPMPPAIEEPSTDSYLCEVRVHCLPDSSDGKFALHPHVKGLVLVQYFYSNGIMVKTGDLRGTYCPHSIILTLEEHIVGVEEQK